MVRDIISGKSFFFRFFKKRERWGLTLMGWFVVSIVAVGVPLALLPQIPGFLAVEERVKGDILVLESWIPDFTIPGAVEEFRRHGYQRLVLTGVPILYDGHLSGFRNYAQVTGARLVTLGLDKEKIVAIEVSDVKRDRTYQSATAIKKWLASSHINSRGVNVYTLDTHSRRSRLLFKKALGDDFAVGVIPARDIRYDPMTWWKSSNGFRTVMDELIAYVYIVVFFNP